MAKQRFSEEDRISPVSAKDLAEAVAEPPREPTKAERPWRMDASSARLRNLEWATYLCKRRACAGLPAPERTPEDLTGIALSGGGIRSATFALGVFQALAEHKVLPRFDYLSTVSGGGYIGSSLTWLTSKAVLGREHSIPHDKGPSLGRNGFGLGPSGRPEEAPFPYGTDDPRTAPEPERSRPEGAMLRYLRQHGNYLTPGKGITFTSGIVVLLRGLVLNLLVWLPIVAAVLAVLAAVPSSWTGRLEGAVLEISPPASGLEGAPRLVGFGLLLGLAVLMLALCVAAFVVYSLATYSAHRREKASYAWSGPLAGWSYPLRRWFESGMRWPLRLAGPFLLVGTVPFAYASLHGWITGPSFTLVGLLGGLVAFARTMQPRRRRAERSGWSIPSAWIASAGAAFLLYGVLLLSFPIGRSAGLGLQAHEYAPAAALGLALALAIATGILVDLNLITIHRFYRDRLMEAFLPDVDRALANETGPATKANDALLSKMCDPAHPVGPYHIINANLVLTESDERTYRLRGGDGFILSPLHCGSNATGWRPTAGFMGGELTLPTAMAISGAAANPWTASGGVGVTRSLLVATLMALMNLRLGFWAPNPRDPSCAGSYRPNHFRPGLVEVLGRTLKEDSPVCLLSDGGHFENLGIYELVRRRTRLIVLCDGTADPDYDFVDLQTALARIWADFGARIEFEDNTLKPFMPSVEADYPAKALLSERAYAIAEITYADHSEERPSEGHLVYLTTTLTKGLRLQLMGYKGANWDFPDQATGDQFFDETQFEAYRELGYTVAISAMPRIKELLPSSLRAGGPRGRCPTGGVADSLGTADCSREP